MESCHPRNNFIYWLPKNSAAPTVANLPRLIRHNPCKTICFSHSIELHEKVICTFIEK
ncbi:MULTISPECIES: IS1 family transposase [Enterobacterales]|uniref:IS1 family transposase n=1 Tax=Enterobacterales TaxID=91347 RepID=UPI003AF40690